MNTYLIKITLESGGRIEGYFKSVYRFEAVFKALERLSIQNREEVLRINIDKVDYLMNHDGDDIGNDF